MRRERGSSGDELAIDPELSLYREYTVALLRRYFSMSIELGRLPSVIGREFFRAKVSSYRIHSFEDVVILVHDVDRCLSKLDEMSQKLIAKAILEEHSNEATAALVGCNRRTVVRRVPEALDRLSEIFLKTGLLRPIGQARPAGRARTNLTEKAEAIDCQKAKGKDCQEAENGKFPASA